MIIAMALSHLTQKIDKRERERERKKVARSLPGFITIYHHRAQAKIRVAIYAINSPQLPDKNEATIYDRKRCLIYNVAKVV